MWDISEYQMLTPFIRLTYGEEYGIYMEKSDGNIQTTKDGKESGGTRVTLRLPVRREKA